MNTNSSDMRLHLATIVEESCLPQELDSSKTQLMLHALHRWLCIENEQSSAVVDCQKLRIWGSLNSGDMVLILNVALGREIRDRTMASYVQAITNLVRLVTPRGEDVAWIATHRYAYLLSSLMRSLQEDLQLPQWQDDRRLVCAGLYDCIRKAYALNIPSTTEPTLTVFDKAIQFVAGKPPVVVQAAGKLKFLTSILMDLAVDLPQLATFNVDGRNYTCTDYRDRFYITYMDETCQWEINVCEGDNCGYGVYDHDKLCAVYENVNALRFVFISAAIILSALSDAKE